MGEISESEAFRRIRNFSITARAMMGGVPLAAVSYKADLLYLDGKGPRVL